MTSSLEGFLLDMNKEFTWYFGQALRGFNVTYKEDSVLLVVKTRDKRGKPIVAFIECATLEVCVEVLYDYCKTTRNHIKWYPDRYAS